MKVKELIEVLQRMDPEMHIYLDDDEWDEYRGVAVVGTLLDKKDHTTSLIIKSFGSSELESMFQSLSEERH